MKAIKSRLTAFRLMVIAGCVYEIAALSTDAVPTLSKIAQTSHKHPVGRVLVWLWCGAWAWHFMDPGK